MVAADALEEDGRGQEARLLRSFNHPVKVKGLGPGETPHVKPDYIPYAWPGGYPLFYFPKGTDDIGGSVILCPDCANSYAEEDPSQPPLEGEIHHEGPDMICDSCNGAIESAYGDPDAPEEPPEEPNQMKRKPASRRRFGLAPKDGIDTFHRAEGQYQQSAQAHPHHNMDAVFADFLDEHEDPRGAIVRQDLQHRGFNSEGEPNWDVYWENMAKYATSKTGLTNNDLGGGGDYPIGLNELLQRRYTSNRGNQTQLPDGSTVDPSFVRDNEGTLRGVVTRLSFRPLHGEKGNVQAMPMYDAFFTPEEYASLEQRLRDEVAKHSGQRMSRRRMARPVAITAIISGDTYALTPHEDGWSVTKTTNQIDRMGSHYQVRCDPNGDPIMCSCPDHFYRKRVCKHMKAVQSTVDSQRLIEQQKQQGQTQQTEGPEATEKLSRRRMRPVRFNNHEAFFKTLHADPRDATGSLVYADYLEENGMPTAAHIIRKHVENWNRGPYISSGSTPLRTGSEKYGPSVEAWHNDFPSADGKFPSSWGIAIFNHASPYESHYHSYVVRDRLEAARLLDSLESEGLPGIKEAREQSGLRTAAEEEGLGPNDRNYTGGMGGADYYRRRFRRDVIPGGLGDTLQVSDVDPEQLKIGIAVEMEHTKDREVAREIALDHLKEDPKYYTKLKRAKLSRKRYSAKFGPTYEALVRAIEADPQDQTARLALADFFEESGYPHHAEYIREAEKGNHFNHAGTSHTPMNPGDTEYSTGEKVISSNLAIKSYREPNTELRWAIYTPKATHRELVIGLDREGAVPFTKESKGYLTQEEEEPERQSRRKFAAYRAPAGGMIARGTAYKGGMMVPDMEGDFMNPQRKERTPSKIDPSKLARLRVSWGKVKKMPKAAVMNADGTSGPAPPPKKRKLA